MNSPEGTARTATVGEASTGSSETLVVPMSQTSLLLRSLQTGIANTSGEETSVHMVAHLVLSCAMPLPMAAAHIDVVDEANTFATQTLTRTGQA